MAQPQKRHKHQQRDNARGHDHHDDAFDEVGHLLHDLVGHLLGTTGYRREQARGTVGKLFKHVLGLCGLGLFLACLGAVVICRTRSVGRLLLRRFDAHSIRFVDLLRYPHTRGYKRHADHGNHQHARRHAAQDGARAPAPMNAKRHRKEHQRKRD